MNVISATHFNLYKKRILNKNNKYDVWYLFVIGESTIIDNIDELYTVYDEPVIQIGIQSQIGMQIATEQLEITQQYPTLLSKWYSPEALKQFVPIVYNVNKEIVLAMLMNKKR